MIAKHRVNGYLVIALILVLPLILPFFHKTLFPMHDWTHVARLSEMTQALTDGQMPPRWSPNLGFGYGMPLFNFYAPLPYYLGSLIVFLGGSYIWAIKLIFIISFFGSFTAAYLFTKEWWGQKAGLLAAVAFMYLPYRAVDVYVRGALGEIYGMMFFVFCLWAMSLTIKHQQKKYIALASLMITGFLLSHNLMVIMCTPFLAIFTIILWIKTGVKLRKGVIFRSLLAVTLGLGLAAFFVMPMLLEQRYTAVSALTTLGGEYQKHFVYLRQLLNSKWGYGGSIEGIFDGMSFEVGKAHLILLGLALVTIAVKRKMVKQRSLLIFITGGLGIALWMTNIRSEWMWANTPILAYIQFPWRYLFLAGFFISVIIGVGISLWTKHSLWLTGLVIAALTICNISYFKPEDYLESNDNNYLTDQYTLQTKVSRTIPEYIHPSYSWLVMQNDTMLEPPKTRFQVLGREVKPAEILMNKSQLLKFRLYPENGGEVIFNLFEYPGWTFYINGKQVNPTKLDEKPVYKIVLPETTSEMGLEIMAIFRETTIRRIANLISLLSLVFIGVILFFDARERRYG